MNEELARKSPRYRFWLAAIALIMSGFFGFLGLGSFSAGQGFASNPDNIDPAVTILTFNFIGIILLAQAPICLWLAWKLRPDGS